MRKYYFSDHKRRKEEKKGINKFFSEIIKREGEKR